MSYEFMILYVTDINILVRVFGKFYNGSKFAAANVCKEY